MRYAFGEFVLDDDTRQLLRAGREVPLTVKAFDLLELLVRARPRALSRTRLHAALWPSTHVGAASLHTLVSQVRAALADDVHEPRWIRTVHRFGYAFRGTASEEGAARPLAGQVASPRLRLSLGDCEWTLTEGETVLGRAEGVPVRIEAGGVSRHHARVVVNGGEATIEDLGSKNGTFVGDDPVPSPRLLMDGDVVRLGRTVRLQFKRGEDEATESEASREGAR
jgi:DNA-binding winged helix-turn-helix (wHTH) protein